MDLDGDGAVDSELEGGEIIEEMKHGGNASKKYIWSDHLKTGGMSFAKKFEQERKRGATPRRIEKLRVEQELAAKRDPSKLYAKYGGMMEYQKGGYRKEDLTRRDKEAIQRYLDGSVNRSKDMFGFGDRSGDSLRLMNRFSETGSFYNPYTREFYQKEDINLGKEPTPLSEMKSGGLMKYQLGSTGPVAEPTVPAGPLAVAAPTTKNQFLNAMLASNRPAATNPNLSVFPMSQYSLAPGSTTAATGTTSQNQANTTPQNRVSRTKAGKFFAEYGAPLANVAGEAVNIGMNLSQKYNPVETISAPDVKAEKVFIDRAKDKRVGARESELIGAKRNLQLMSGPKSGKLNALRMTSLRAQEEAAQNVYDQNRQASSTEQQLNQAAQLKAAMTNQANARLESESRRNEGLRKESFENMRKKYIGSAASGLGNQLAQGMYTKEYINATLPEGVDQYALKPRAISDQMKKINPATGKKYTYADAINAVLIQYNLENP